MKIAMGELGMGFASQAHICIFIRFARLGNNGSGADETRFHRFSGVIVVTQV